MHRPCASCMLECDDRDLRPDCDFTQFAQLRGQGSGFRAVKLFRARSLLQMSLTFRASGFIERSFRVKTDRSRGAIIMGIIIEDICAICQIGQLVLRHFG